MGPENFHSVKQQQRIELFYFNLTFDMTDIRHLSSACSMLESLTNQNIPSETITFNAASTFASNRKRGNKTNHSEDSLSINIISNIWLVISLT